MFPDLPIYLIPFEVSSLALKSRAVAEMVLKRPQTKWLNKSPGSHVSGTKQKQRNQCVYLTVIYCDLSPVTL